MFSSFFSKFPTSISTLTYKGSLFISEISISIFFFQDFCFADSLYKSASIFDKVFSYSLSWSRFFSWDLVVWTSSSTFLLRTFYWETLSGESSLICLWTTSLMNELFSILLVETSTISERFEADLTKFSGVFFSDIWTFYFGESTSGETNSSLFSSEAWLVTGWIEILGYNKSCSEILMSFFWV